MEYEVLTGIVSGATVAPLISIVDKAIFSNASGKATFMDSIRESVRLAATKPLQFLKGPSVLWIWAVYGATYVSSNVSERYAKTKDLPVAYTVLGATSTTNIGMSVLKDRAFSRMYGTTAPRPLPFTSLACYGTRDFITVTASFTLVQPIANALTSEFGLEKSNALLLSQLFCPILAQLTNTPIFLYGMDLYNKSEATTAQRVQFIKSQYWNTFMLRIARIGPAFSIGGVINRYLRGVICPPIEAQQ